MQVQNTSEKTVNGENVAQKAPEANARREEAPAVPGAATDLLLGRGVRFEGKLTFAGTVRIDASFVGTIVTNDVLVVGEAARIDANITCGTIVVHGEVNGNIQAKAGVEILGSAKVRGDVETPSLVVERGGFFEGASRMDPAAKARAKTAA
jgi:cytoskeletal protein CcmA (bactofilin family)